MKKLIVIVLFLFASVCFAEEQIQITRLTPAIMGGGSSAVTCADSSCSGFLVCQNFEGAGYDNSESWSEIIGTNGICDEDDTTATILRGSQQLKIYGGDAGQMTRTSHTHAAQNEIYGHFKFLTPDATPASNTTIWQGLNTSAAAAFAILLYTDGTLRMTHGTNGISTVGTLSDNTAYHIWFRWKISTGSDGLYSIGFSTTTTEPTSGNNYVSGSNGTHTVQVDRGARAYSNNQGTFYFDQILIKTTSIGNVCE